MIPYNWSEPNYGVIRPLRLETASYVWFVDPYGPDHAGAIGKIYAWDKIPYGFESHKYVTFIKRIEPLMEDGECLPVKFIRRISEFIEVQADFTGSRLWDKGKHDGQIIQLYPWVREDEENLHR